MADDVIGAIVHQAKKGGAGGSGTRYNETEAQHLFDDYYLASYSPSLVCMCVYVCVCVCVCVFCVCHSSSQVIIIFIVMSPSTESRGEGEDGTEG